MEQKKSQKKKILIQQRRKMTDPEEWERIMQTHQGIFQGMEAEYIKTIIPLRKRAKNYSQ